MYAIVSLLDDRHYPRLKELWRELEYDCSLTGITITPIPHFSWHIAAEYDFKRLEERLAEIAASAEPFRVHTGGLGLFTGESPVVYIPVVKDMILTRFHKRLWEGVHPTAIGATSHYSPDVWVPHITLAHGDVKPGKLGCAMEKLAFRSYDWQIRVDHLALVYQFSGQVGKIQSKFPFGG
jgi:2'-5' RNA ligase